MINLENHVQTARVVIMTAGGVAGTALLTVDIASSLEIDISIDNGVVTLPDPTDKRAGLIIHVTAKAKPFIMYGKSINSGTFESFIWNGTGYATRTNVSGSGNIIAMGIDYTTNQFLQFDNLKVAWNATLDRYEIATVKGTHKIIYVGDVHWGSELTYELANNYSGGAGIDASPTDIGIIVTTTPRLLGDQSLYPVDSRTYHLSLDTGEQYTLSIVKKGLYAGTGNVDFTVYKKIVNSELAKNTREQGKTFKTNTGLTLSEVTVGDITVRYSSNAIAGNLDVRSSNASNLAINWYSTEKFTSQTNNGYKIGNANLNPTTGAFTLLNAGDLGVNELLLYTIVTAKGNIFEVTIANIGTVDTTIFLQQKF